MYIEMMSDNLCIYDSYCFYVELLKKQIDNAVAYEYS
jgi:hypothetical protein